MGSRKLFYIAFVFFGLYELVFLDPEIGLITLILASIGFTFDYFQNKKSESNN